MKFEEEIRSELAALDAVTGEPLSAAATGEQLSGLVLDVRLFGPEGFEQDVGANVLSEHVGEEVLCRWLSTAGTNLADQPSA